MLAYPGDRVLTPILPSPAEVVRKAVGQMMAKILVDNCKQKICYVLVNFGIGFGYKPLPYPWVWEI
jgi:hypothetical protein